MKTWLAVTCLSLAMVVTGCRTTYYGLWETFGVQKRDLLKKKVTASRDAQKEATEQFKDALTRLKELYGFQGGDLEKVYNKLKGEYEQSDSKVKAASERVAEMDRVAQDLFAEWEKELNEIGSSDLRSRSRAQLRDTKDRYQDLYATLHRSEQSMDPVLARLKDQVLYLKHNLNAQALDALRSESQKIQVDISQVIEEMNRAVAEADEFIRAMETNSKG